MRRTILLALCPFALAAQALNSPSFDVASVKLVPTQPGGGARANIVAHPGTLAMHYIRLRDCIKWAYDVRQYQIVGPAWLGGARAFNEDRYEIMAKGAKGTPVDQLRIMLRTLLAERFKLTVHQQTKDTSCYALVALKKAAALQPVEDDDSEERIGGGGTVVNGIKISMASFAEGLTGLMGAPVLDMTNMKGRYNFSINYSPYLPPDKVPTNDDIQAATLEALQQLGFKIERRRSPIEMLVIDHLEKVPTDN